MNIQDIERNVLSGNLQSVLNSSAELMNHAVMLLNNDSAELEDIRSIVNIYNLIYGNSAREDVLISDTIYDLLVQKLIAMGGKRPNGNAKICFGELSDDSSKQNKRLRNAISFSKKEDIDKIQMYPELFTHDIHKNLFYGNYSFDANDLKNPAVKFNNTLTKRLHDSQHTNPGLVGTLDKCKYVLVQDAIDAGEDLNDPKVKILERDFFGEHIKHGIINQYDEFEVMIELKYDGLSIEGLCSNVVTEAYSRGDTDAGLASDMTGILKGYPFTKSPFIIEQFPIKFEAVMKYSDLYIYNKIRGKDYKNCRTAISSIFESSDAPMLRDLITLVPLDMDESTIPPYLLELFPDSKRVATATFLNTYYTQKGLPFIMAIEKGNYSTILFLIKKFLEEAELSRSRMPCMYDGIVVEYTSDKIRKILGRKDHINKYAMAVKFNPLKKQAIVTGMYYTVGKTGYITPMVQYTPVEFLGTIHTDSSLHSLSRFNDIALKPGDVIDVTYTHDVMPYVTKPQNSDNDANQNAPYEFTTTCPVCGGKIEFSETGKSAYCKNPECKGASIAIATDLLYGLGFSGFGFDTVMKMGVLSLKDFMEIPHGILQDRIGVADSLSFVNQRNKYLIDCKPIKDYDLLGAMGFPNIGPKKWKKILNQYDLIDELLPICRMKDYYSISKIKGMGTVTARVIIDSFEAYDEDISYAITNFNIIKTKGTLVESNVKIRFTGCRDKELCKELVELGYDADDEGSVSSSTTILLIKNKGFTSGKISKVSENTLVIPIDEFKANMQEILSNY